MVFSGPNRRAGRICSVKKRLYIEPGSKSDYLALSRFHYREKSLGPYSHIFAIREGHPVRKRFAEVVGVIVYRMPSPSLEMRNAATGGVFTGFGGRDGALELLNRNVRCISRVIIDPRYRGLNLAAGLVEKTLERVGVPVVETLAVMGRFHPFFERAGMRAFHGKRPPACVRLEEAFSVAGIEAGANPEPNDILSQIREKTPQAQNFICSELRLFLQVYGKARHLSGLGQMLRYALTKLTDRPVYYIWVNERILPERFGCLRGTVGGICDLTAPA